MSDQATLAAATATGYRPARRLREAAPEAAAVLQPEATAAGLLAVFFAAMLLPLNFSLGGLSLTPVRLFLLVAFVPLAVRWVTGAAGRITATDVLLGLHCLWVGLALLVVNGTERFAYAGITIVEIFGSYLVGRTLIRNVTDYRLFFRYFLIALAILAPFVAVEMKTARLLVSEVLQHIAGVHPKLQTGEQRMGFYRAQSVLEHPILWGVFCSLAISNVFYIYREKFAKSVILTGFATLMTFTSLSSAPLLSAAIQFGMIGWGWITRYAWWILAGLAVLGYVVVDLISNRTPVQVLITYLTFNSGTAYWRIHIWNYGSQEVWRHPLFGIGLNDWQRPYWMGTASVDNFWLLTTMRYGLPAFLLLVAGVGVNLFNIIRADLAEHLKDIRRGYVIATVGLVMTLCTVHAWGAVLVVVMFYFGAGSWFYTGAIAPAVPARGTRQRGPAAGPPAAAEDLPPAVTREERAAQQKAARLERRRAQYSGRNRNEPPRHRRNDRIG